MKKLLLLCMILVLTLSLCACSQSKDPESVAFIFPEDSSLMGVNLAGQTKDAAEKSLQDKIEAYTLALTVDGVTQTITAPEIGLTFDSQRLNACVDALAQGITPDPTGVVSYNQGKLRALMDQYFNHSATDASIVYDEVTGTFVLIPDADGQSSNPNAIVAALEPVIAGLESQATLSDVSQILYPVRTAEDAQVTEALAAANKMLTTRLTYAFTPEDTTHTHEIPADVIRSFIAIDDDGITPIVHQETLEAYVTELSEQYGVEGTTGNFRATGGGTIGLTVSYNGSYVDNAALVADITESIQEGRNETRTAPYLESGTRDMPYGGTSIEVNLSSQHLWFYKNGTCIVSTPLVSGKVAENMCTPTGVFSLYQRKAGAWLEGDDYRTYVNFWMPFYYGYGLHDATWRSSFGGSIYLYSGSHGCVNLPYSATSTIFNNSTVGTEVILYGGERSVPPVSQSLSGTTSYDIADDTGSFTLNIKAKHGEPKLVYSSSNAAVASVSPDGTVTVNGIGTAQITVTAPKHSDYTEATTTVTGKVHSACDDGRHKYGTPTQIKAPTCQPGLEKVTCSKCNYSAEQEVKATEKHSYGEWVTIKEPTCGAEGTQERTCTKCNLQKETGTIPATGQHTEGDWEVTQKPTCISEGIMQTKCTVCGAAMRTEKIPVSGEHTLGDWKTVQEATCTTDGAKAKYCIHCNEPQEIGTIPASHKPGDWQTTQDATCSAAGTKVKNCTVCGTQVDTAIIEKKSHSFGDGPSCTNCGAANPNYTAPATE